MSLLYTNRQLTAIITVILIIYTVIMYIWILFTSIDNTTLNNASFTDLYVLHEKQTPKFYDNGLSQLNRNKFYTNIDHKLIFCFIQKNVNTMFRNLWFAVERNDPLIYHIDTRKNKSDPQLPYHNHLHIYNLENKEILNTKYNSYIEKVTDTNWTKIVIIREPLERLLSGFLDRCLWVYETYENTNECFGEVTNNFTFSDFVERIIDKTKRKDYITNPHYWPQSWFCELDKYLNEYQFVIKYDYYSIGKYVLELLKYVNLSDYYYHWGEYFNETMFTDSVHVTYEGGNELQSKVKFYKQYYTKQLAVKCLKLFQDDYQLFNFSYPEWINYLD
eukprot:187927_1